MTFVRSFTEDLRAIDRGWLRGHVATAVDVAPDDQRFLMGRRPEGVDRGEQPKLILVVSFAEELKARLP